MNVCGIGREPRLVKRKDNLVALDLPCASLGGGSLRTLHEVATVVIVDDNGIEKLIDSDVIPGLRLLAGVEHCRESSIELRSRRYSAIELLSMALVGKQPNRNVRRRPINHNRRRRAHVLGAHGGCAVKNCGGEAN